MAYGVYSAPVWKSSIDWSDISKRAISLVVNLAKKVAQVVRSCFDAVANTFYDLLYSLNLWEPRLVWPVLPIGSLGNFSVNGANISKVKQGEAVDFDRLLCVFNHAKPPIRLEELLEQFDKVFQLHGSFNSKRYDRFFQDGAVSVSFGQARDLIKSGYIDFVRSGANSQWNMPENEITNTSNLLKGIAYELRSPGLSVEKKKEIFEKLANGAGHCPPRRHEEAMIIYRHASNPISTMEDVVLEKVQLIKEALFRTHYSLSTESAATLNYIRKTVGRRLGLDGNAVSLRDRYIHMHDARSPDNPSLKHTTSGQFLHVFNKIYTPENIFNLMKEWLNNSCSKDSDFAAEMGLFFNNSACKGEADWDSPLLNSYQDQTTRQITDNGILFLLTHFRVLREHC